MIAVIHTGGKQYTVRENDRIKVEKIPLQDRTDDRVVFRAVLLSADDKNTVKVGRPYVPDARVEARVVRDGRLKKVRVVKYKPKVRYRKVTGHRQPFTEIRIEKIIS